MKNIKKLYSPLIIFSLISLSLIVFLIYPTFSDIKKSSKEVVLSKEMISNIFVQDRQLESFKKSFSQYETNLTKADRMFVDPENPVEFIKFLEKTAFGLGISININLDVDSKEKDSEFLLSSFRISAKGVLPNILEFSQKLENGPYLLKINQLSLDNNLSEAERENKMVWANFLINVLNKQYDKH